MPSHDVTPSTNSTVTLPTPDPVHAQLAGAAASSSLSPSIRSHNPPRFIFYPISWDGSEGHEMQSKRPCLDTLQGYANDDALDYSPTVVLSTDTFHSIDRWRRDVITFDDNTVGLLDPIHDADTPLPLLSLPCDHRGGHHQDTQPAKPPPRGTVSTGSEDSEVQLWIHP